MRPELATYLTTFSMPLEMRARLDALRLARAQREGGLPPYMKDVILEALEQLLERELTQVPACE